MIEIETTDSEILRGHREAEDKTCPHPVAVAEVAAVEVVAAEAAVAVAVVVVVTINLETPTVLVRNS